MIKRSKENFLHSSKDNFTNKDLAYIQGAKTFHRLTEIFDKFLQEQKQDHIRSLEHHQQKKRQLFPDKLKIKVRSSGYEKHTDA